MADSENQEKAVKKQKVTYDPEEYAVRKRLPPKLPKKPTDVYVTNKTNFKTQLSRCKRLLEEKETTIYIHGLGAALPRAINLALTLQEEFQGIIDVSPTTSTVDLVDDLEPLQSDVHPQTQTRKTSAIHIKLTKVMPSLPNGATQASASVNTK